MLLDWEGLCFDLPSSPCLPSFQFHTTHRGKPAPAVRSQCRFLAAAGPAINPKRSSASAPFVGNSMRLICVDNLPRLTNVASK